MIENRTLQRSAGGELTRVTEAYATMGVGTRP
jgi:hypothetical protein